METPVESVTALPPHHWKQTSKALQFVTDRAKPLMVPVLCELWDRIPADTMRQVVAAMDKPDPEKAIEHAFSLSVFPIPDHVQRIVFSLLYFRLVIK